MIQYRLHNFEFDSALWAEKLNECDHATIEAVRELSGLSKSAFWHWLMNRYPAGINYPNMTNFLAICNLLDLNPAVFFKLEN